MPNLFSLVQTGLLEVVLGEEGKNQWSSSGDGDGDRNRGDGEREPKSNSVIGVNSGDGECEPRSGVNVWSSWNGEGEAGGMVIRFKFG